MLWICSGFLSMYRTDGCLNTRDLYCTDYRVNCCYQFHECWRTGKGMLEMVGGNGYCVK